MRSISDFLSKFARLAKDSAQKLETINRIIKENAGVDVPVSALKQNKSTLFISVHPLIKSEVFMHKEKILNALKEQKIIISDIR
jgi:hypothetical protein